MKSHLKTKVVISLKYLPKQQAEGDHKILTRTQDGKDQAVARKHIEEDYPGAGDKCQSQKLHFALVSMAGNYF